MTGTEPLAGEAVVGFKRHLRAEAVPGEAVYLLSVGGVTALHGPHIEALAPLLDGTRTLSRVLSEAASSVPPAAAGRVVGRLAQANLISYRDPAPGRPAAAEEQAYWDFAGLDSAAATRRLARTSVEVRAVGRADRDAAVAACLAAGLTVVGEDPAAKADDDGPPASPTRGGPPAGVGTPGPPGPGGGRPGALGTGTTGVALGRAGGAARGAGSLAGPAPGPGTTAGATPLGALGAAAAGTGAPGAAAADEPGLLLVVCDDYLDPELREIDARQRAAGRPWLLAKPHGPQTWVGPVFDPGEGPCWSCLAHRLLGHRVAEEPVRRALGSPGPLPIPETSLAVGRAFGLQAAVLEAVKWLAGVRNDTQGAVCVLDTLTLGTELHPVVRRPQCAACGDPGLVAERAWRPFRVVPRAKAPNDSANDRALPAAETLARYRHLVSGVTGAVTDLQRDPNAVEGINSYVSGRNLAMGGNTLAEVRSGLRQLSGGKGTTPLEAEVGALCEALERYSGTRQGDEATVRDTLVGLGEQALHPNAVQLFHERQFADRARWNASHTALHRVCDPFDPRRPVDWTPVWSLTRQRHRLLPTSMLYYSDQPPAGLPWADSNGNAAGSSPEDALLQGFFELVERDAVALWWYNRLRLPLVDLDAFDEPWLARLRDVYGGLERELWVLDLTSDLGVPVMAALSRRTDKPAEDIAFGFGAHFDPRLALRRAVTEMGQLLSPVARAAADGTGYSTQDPELLSWWTTATVANQPYLLPDSAESARGPAHYAHEPRADLHRDVEAAGALVRAHGMELLVLDQTRPDVGLPVVKVIVPGLRHFWARFGPGRLFDVPVRLGHRSSPIPYDDLNPIPMFA
ncbi:TOMM precursor leader peptide-binding protein [Streptomyces sp. URMC 123]|uniref:TOMM precursor leader peptide-binding protein n=1 Tax=Streptomyces sp. URMC 123 TaxID=3423403 RepID=UPI003F1B1E97